MQSNHILHDQDQGHGSGGRLNRTVNEASPTWPRWPKSQELACGLLKQDSLCVSQACRARSFSVQSASRAPRPVASADRSWQVQLRAAAARTDILEERRERDRSSEDSRPAWRASVGTMRSVERCRKLSKPDHECFDRATVARYEWRHFLYAIK